MSTNISEGLPAKKKAAPVVSAPKGGDKPDAKKGGTAENSGKRIRQAVYDIRYRARREDIDLKQAFSQYMSNTSMDQKDRAEVRSKLFGKGGVSEQYIGASDDWAIESFSKAFTTVFEHHQKDKDGNTIPHEDEFVTEYERKLSEEKARKYKVRVTDPKSEKSYVRYADREKITALRGKGLKVEMTEYGTPYEGEKKRGEETAKALGGGKKAKKDYDGDGKIESGAKEYRGVVHNKIQQKKGGKADGQDTSSVKEGMATPESGTGKYYVEGKPTKKQLEVRAQQAKNRAASNKGKMAEETIEEKKGSLKQARKNVGASTCWDGYKAKGTKMKGGKSVPNCVKEEDVTENRRVAHNPEKYKPEDESDKPYRQRSRENRMKDPKRGINSPAFKKFMADRGMSASYEPTLPMLESKKKL